MRQNQILLLDEDKSLSRFLCKELHSQGYLVDHLTDADEVFREAREALRRGTR